jgi:hypothetical protein
LILMISRTTIDTLGKGMPPPRSRCRGCIATSGRSCAWMLLCVFVMLAIVLVPFLSNSRKIKAEVARDSIAALHKIGLARSTTKPIVLFWAECSQDIVEVQAILGSPHRVEYDGDSGGFAYIYGQFDIIIRFDMNGQKIK